MRGANLPEFHRKAENTLDNVSAHFRELRDNLRPDVFQPFCDKILDLARKVQALRDNDAAIPTRGASLVGLAAEAAALADTFEQYLVNLPPTTPRVRGAGTGQDAQDSLLDAVVVLGEIIAKERKTTFFGNPTP